MSQRARGRTLGITGLFVALGFLVLIGVLMSAVASTKTVRDKRGDAGPLDITAVTVRHTDKRVFVSVTFADRLKARDLRHGGRVFANFDTGDGFTHVVSLSAGRKGLAVSLGRCDADACAWSDAGRGERTGAASVEYSVKRVAIPGLSDRVEWWAGAVDAAGTTDYAPNSGARFHHL